MCFSVNAQHVTLSGTLTDQNTGEKLIGANIYLVQQKKGTVANSYGFYSLRLPKNQPVKLRYSYLGYKPIEIEASFEKDTTIDVSMAIMELEEVTIIAERRKIFSPSINEIQIISPKNLPYPSLKPEIDILDVVRQMPGVQPGLEVR